MNSRELFMKEIEELIIRHEEELSISTIEYFETLKTTMSEKKEEFTKGGKAILMFLQTQEKELWKAKDIADAMEIASRSVSGSMRKLVTDGYVEKVGKDPVIYALTDKGREIKINEEEETE